LHVLRQRGRDADVARDPDPQPRALDLDLGETGFVQQQCEFTDQRTVTALEFWECFVVRLARHMLIRNLLLGDARMHQAFALAPILAARPLIASR
jgi:hypothetical protein